jgi:hypothetical protein
MNTLRARSFRVTQELQPMYLKFKEERKYGSSDIELFDL